MTGMGKSLWCKQNTAHLTRLITLDHQKEYRRGVIVETFQDLTDYLKQSPRSFRCICRFQDKDEIFAAIELAWELGNCTLLAEEVSIICRPNWIDENLEKITLFGRHRNVSLVATTQRPALVHRSITAIAEKIVAFRHEETSDLEYLKDRGFDPEQVRMLDRLQYLEKGSTTIQRITI